MPAVRGYRKLTITLVQISSGTVGASTVGLLTAAAVGALDLGSVGIRTLATICLLTGLADVAYRRWGRPRPLALYRQVPRYWGHKNGPWKASLRYGLRMGVGPATILTTWTWWAALVVCALGGPWVSVLGAIVYATIRFVVSSASSVGVSDGSAMARRSAKLDSMRAPIERVAVAAPFLALCGLYVARFAA